MRKVGMTRRRRVGKDCNSFLESYSGGTPL